MAKHWEDALLKLEGQEGSVWRYARARRLLDAAKDIDDPQFAEADRLQTEIRKIRPSWAPGYLLGGIIHQQRGKFAEAADDYQEAIRLGYRQLAVYEPLVALLNKLGRYSEAENCLAGLQNKSPGTLFLYPVFILRRTQPRRRTRRLARGYQVGSPNGRGTTGQSATRAVVEPFVGNGRPK